MRTSEFRKGPLWTTAKRFAVDPARRAVAAITSRGEVPVSWCLGNNWGDALSPVLVRLISGRRVIRRVDLHYDRYLVIGSILGGANERAEVWGSGFIREEETVVGAPRAVQAVRGPLSRQRLLNLGIDCPEVYGDPALLLPRFYSPSRSIRHSVGIIPHYIDKGHPWLEQFRDDRNVLLIDVESGITDFVNAVESCDVILSSSLHGLICADAYGAHTAWIGLSDEVIGGDFKFRDYRASIGWPDPVRHQIRNDTPLETITGAAEVHPLQIDLRKLLLACPFLSGDLRSEIDSAEPHSCGLPERFKSATLNSTEQVHG